MRLLIQRVNHADVKVDGETVGSIGKGFLVLVGVGQNDTREIADKYLKKMLGLRIFEDAITFRIALMVVKYMNFMENFEY